MISAFTFCARLKYINIMNNKVKNIKTVVKEVWIDQGYKNKQTKSFNSGAKSAI